MNILYFVCGNNNDKTILSELNAIDGVNAYGFSEELKDYLADSKFSLVLMQEIHGKNIDAVFSIDYYPIISMICEVVKKPYISWIVDCPMLTLMSKTIGNECNYIFNFDRLYAQKVSELGCKHSIHLPLGGARTLLSDALLTKGYPKIEGTPCVDEQSKYYGEISMVGSLYSEKKRNRYRGLKLSEHTKGFVEGLIRAQEAVYGYNLLRDALTDDVVNEYASSAELSLSDMYYQDTKGLVADSIGIEVNSRDRENALVALSKVGEVSLYTGSEFTKRLKDAGVKNKGTIGYTDEMPLVFKNSKINLNITSRTIESGVPLRVFDILICGGFCMTNYQPEIAEMFEDGVDLVMYSSLEDLVVKADYYLKHEDERRQIAENGYKKILENYTIGHAVCNMFEIMKEEGAL